MQGKDLNIWIVLLGHSRKHDVCGTKFEQVVAMLSEWEFYVSTNYFRNSVVKFDGKIWWSLNDEHSKLCIFEMPVTILRWLITYLNILFFDTIATVRLVVT